MSILIRINIEIYAVNRLIYIPVIWIKMINFKKFRIIVYCLINLKLKLITLW